MTTTTFVESMRDEAEANARRRMAEFASLPSRGWDGERKRAEKMAQVDRDLDAWLALQD